MAQNDIDFSIDPSGEQLLDTLLTGMQENILTGNSGSSRPSYAQNGTLWVDKTSSPWVWKMFNGTDDIIIGNIDPTGLDFTPSEIPEILNNYEAIAAPTVGDDENDGYEPGSKWFFDGDIWLCVNADSGVAQWVDTGLQLTDLGGLASLNLADLPDATDAVRGFVELADAAEVTAGTAGKVVDAAQLKSKASNVRTLGRSYASTSTRDTTTTAIPADNTKPTSSEGKEFLSSTYTRISATSTLIVRFGGSISSSVGALCCVALFNGGSEAVSTLPSNAASSGSQEFVSGVYEQASGAVGDITFSLRFGANAGTAHLNGNSAIAGDLYGATNNSFLEIIEVE